MIHINHRGPSNIITFTQRDHGGALCWPEGGECGWFGFVARSADSLTSVHFVLQDMSPSPGSYQMFTVTGGTGVNEVDLSPAGRWSYEMYLATGSSINDIVITDQPYERGLIQVAE